jgi:hypothetical protein
MPCLHPILCGIFSFSSSIFHPRTPLAGFRHRAPILAQPDFRTAARASACANVRFLGPGDISCRFSSNFDLVPIGCRITHP